MDENGRQFVLTSDGSIEFGRVDAESGLTPAPILLSEGIITNPQSNDGYGLVHIEARHGDQIRKAGYKSVVSFVEEVAKNYDLIMEGKDRNGNQTYRLILTDRHNNTLMVELSGDGTYWNINTAGIFKHSYGANKNIVYSRHTTANQSAETDGASLSGEQGGTTPSTSMNAPTLSAGKDTKKSAHSEKKSEKSSESGENEGGKKVVKIEEDSHFVLGKSRTTRYDDGSYMVESANSGGGKTIANYNAEGVPDGASRVYDREGRLLYQVTYKNGEKDGVEEEYIDGVLRQRRHYKDGKEDGVLEVYNPDGSLNRRNIYKDGEFVRSEVSAEGVENEGGNVEGKSQGKEETTEQPKQEARKQGQVKKIDALVKDVVKKDAAVNKIWERRLKDDSGGQPDYGDTKEKQEKAHYNLKQALRDAPEEVLERLKEHDDSFVRQFAVDELERRGKMTGIAKEFEEGMKSQGEVSKPHKSGPLNADVYTSKEVHRTQYNTPQYLDH